MPQIYISPHNKIGYLFLSLTILIFIGLIFGLLGTSYGAEIIIIPQPEEIDINFEVQIKEESSIEESRVLTGRVLESIQEGQEKTNPQATVSMESYAEGEIVLTNNTWSPINFVASTRFASPQGLIFRAINRIRIPSRGETTVPVRADKMGQDHEIGPAQFTIPNLKDPFLKKNIIAESKKPMTGGLERTGIVMQADIDKVKKELKEKLYQRGVGEIEKELPEANLKIVVQSTVLEEKSDAQAGDEKAEFTVLEKIKIGAVAFEEDILLGIALDGLEEKIPQGKELAAYEPNGLSYRLKEYDIEQHQALLHVQLRGYMVINSDNQILEKARFRELSPQEIENYFKDFKEIEQVQVKLRPPLILKKTPNSVDKIKIKVVRKNKF